MPVEQYHVDGDTAVVTGGSSGIGKRIAEKFAADGVDVAVCSRTYSDVEETAAELSERGTGDVLPVGCDVRNEAAVDAMIEATVEEFGVLDVLVNNASTNFMAPFEEISAAGWKRVVETNLLGTFHCLQAAAPHLQNDGGAVVNISSTSGQRGTPEMSHYSAAKAALIRLTETLGYEWAPKNVRVNSVTPGFVATEGVARRMGVDLVDVDREDANRRMGTTEEIADVVQFLVSRAASYITGQNITVRGKPVLGYSPDV